MAAFDAAEAGRWMVAVIGGVLANASGEAERNDLSFRAHLLRTTEKTGILSCKKAGLDQIRLAKRVAN